MKKSKSLSRLERQSPTAEEIWNIKTKAFSWIKVKTVQYDIHNLIMNVKIDFKTFSNFATHKIMLNT